MTTRLRNTMLAVTLAATPLLGCRALEPETEIGRAAAFAPAEALESLLKAGADPNLFESHGVAPLHIAARRGRVEAIRALVKGGAELNLRDRRNGWTPLLHAVHKRRHAAVAVLLEAGADPNQPGEPTPLVMAAGYGETRIVRALLARGADPRARSGPPAATPLWAAVGGGAILDLTDGPRLGSCFPETVKALLEHAPDLRLVEGRPLTTLVRTLAVSDQCREAFALIERGTPRAAGRS